MKGFLIGCGILLSVVAIDGIWSYMRLKIKKKDDRKFGIIVNEETGEWRPI